MPGGIYQANLDNFLRQVINEEELELSSPLPFHRAPPDVRDALLQKVETDDENRDGILCALAWIGDEVVVEHFNRWRQEPPAWSASLHILPHRYAHQAGWELTEKWPQARSLLYAMYPSGKTGT